MDKKALLTNASEIFRLVDKKLFALAFSSIHNLIDELSQWWASAKCEELETLCKQILKYSLGDVEDPERNKIIAKLQYDMYVLVDDVIESIAIKDLSTFEYEQIRINKIEEFNYDEIINNIKKSDSSTYSDLTTNSIDLVFRHIWLMGKMNEADVNFVMNIISDENVILSLREMVISALMLKCLRYYDLSVLNILVDTVDIDSIEIRSRVITSLLILLSVYDKRILKDTSLRDKLDKLLSDEKFVKEIGTAYKYIIKTFGTKKVTKKINNEIYPELMKSSSKIREMLKSQNLESSDDDDAFNPKWEKVLDENGAADKLRQFSDMQMNGEDVYMSTFSYMKGYAFFRNIAHWFMPFDEKQQDVARQLAIMPNILKMFAASNNMCNSDKYSFINSISQIPEENLKTMLSGFGDSVDELKDELGTLEVWKENEEVRFNTTLRMYVLDLYRFYELYPHRYDFIRPLQKVGILQENGFLFKSLPLSLKESVCKYLFEVGYFVDAMPWFEYLDSQQVWDAFFYQQMGHCYQSIEMWEDAINSYEKSDLLEPNDLWTLKHKALCYKKISQIDKAIECYKNILSIKEDDIAATVNLAGCYMELNDYKAARGLYYKVNYLRPNNIRVVGELAWCMFLDKDYANAGKYFDKLLANNEFSVNDALKAGHNEWALGNKDKARECYKKAKLLIDDDSKFVSLFYDDSSYLNTLGLKSDDILILINQVLYL